MMIRHNFMTVSNYFIGRSVSNLDKKKHVGIPLGEIWNIWLQILADAFSLVSLGGESVKNGQSGEVG